MTTSGTSAVRVGTCVVGHASATASSELSMPITWPACSASMLVHIPCEQPSSSTVSERLTCRERNSSCFAHRLLQLTSGSGASTYHSALHTQLAATNSSRGQQALFVRFMHVTMH
eukprot:GHUV01038106.1.p1 GENE.GHUV01038106.1~~GHUV01038106.1.p1  ORF type:complete len:115 (-),score=20.05 GHUV01038106.1:80-424(-)